MDAIKKWIPIKLKVDYKCNVTPQKLKDENVSLVIFNLY
jgi:hypothetical protein